MSTPTPDPLQAHLWASLVRIFNNTKGTVVGGGFLVAEGLVCTCAHVVNAALGLDEESQTIPAEPLVQVLDFPGLKSGRLDGQVVPEGWQPIKSDDGGDIAILRLDGPLPPGARPAPLVALNIPRGRSVRAYGFAEGYRVGVNAYAELQDRQTNGNIQLAGVRTTGLRIAPGFSGTALWDEQDQDQPSVVGMVVMTDRNPSTKVAYMIPPELLQAAYPPLHLIWRRQGYERSSRKLVGLPVRPSEFVGRDTELAAILTALQNEQEGAVAVAITGMGGLGKSTLAAEVVQRLSNEPDHFAGGIAWVNCANLNGESGLILMYDQILDVWERRVIPGRDRENALAIIDPVRARELALPTNLDRHGLALVVLDNVESALPLTRAIDALNGRGISILATSRTEPALGRLELVRLNVLEVEAAVQLFVARFKAKGGLWEDHAEQSAVKVVVEQLGRLPLAIELAAARAARVSERIQQLADELRQPEVLQFLQDPIDPSASVRYVLGQSLTVLKEAQTVRFAALGLLGASDIPETMVIPLLAAIIPQDTTSVSAERDLDLFAGLSLVRRMGKRVSVHPLLLALAEERWQAVDAPTQYAGEVAALEAIATYLQDHEHDIPLLRRDEGLFVGIFHHAAQQGVAPEQLCKATARYWTYLDVGGRWRLGIEILGWELAARRAIADRAGEATTLHNLGWLSLQLADYAGARQLYEQALVLRREVQDRRGEAATLDRLGLVADRQGRLEEAPEHFKEALVIAEQEGDPRILGSTFNNRGLNATSRGKMTAARHYFRRALTFRRLAGDRRGEGTTLGNMGYLMYQLGNQALSQDNPAQALRYFGQGQRYYKRALAIAQEVSDVAGENLTLRYLGRLAAARGEGYDKASHYYEQALAIDREIGDFSEEGETLFWLGELAQTTGDEAEAQQDHSGARRFFVKAAEYFKAVLPIVREGSNLDTEGAALANLGSLAYEQRKFAQAKRYYKQALAVYQKQGARRSMGVILFRLAEVAETMGDLDSAEALHRDSLGIAIALKNDRDLADSLSELGRFLNERRGDRNQGCQCFGEAVQVYKQLGLTDREDEVRAIARELGCQL
jgi:tetratricopeptide (TPR) repeat protein